MAVLTDISSLQLQYNAFKQELPTWLGSLTKLSVLGMGNNQFSGTIPESFSELTDLVLLGLDDNFISGDIMNLKELTKMRFLYLEDNNISQPLDMTFLSPMKDLEELDLSDNNLNGTLPLQVFQYEKLEVLGMYSGRGFIQNLSLAMVRRDSLTSISL
jgi:Leucine-rich repeat (LRR) protein